MWIVAMGTLIVCLALGWLINAVLFVPYRVKPIYRFLYQRSPWYRRWVLRRIIIPSLKRMPVGFKMLIPAAKRANEVFCNLTSALAKLQPPSIQFAEKSHVLMEWSGRYHAETDLIGKTLSRHSRPLFFNQEVLLDHYRTQALWVFPFYRRLHHDLPHFRAVARLDFRARNAKTQHSILLNETVEVTKKYLYRVVLKYDMGLTRSVFIKATSRKEAERRALHRYRTAIGIDRSMSPLT